MSTVHRYIFTAEVEAVVAQVGSELLQTPMLPRCLNKVADQHFECYLIRNANEVEVPTPFLYKFSLN